MIEGINYVIATWCGKNTKRTIHKIDYPKPEFQLREHLKQLLKYDLTAIKQITIMKPKPKKNDQIYQKYYEFADLLKQLPKHIEVVQPWCENYGWSNGQWLTAYEKFPDFAYYIFIEDDYCPMVNNFDLLSIEAYQQIFPDGLGKLCGFVQGKPYTPDSIHPLHYESTIIINNNTLKTLYQVWGNPRKQMGIEARKLADARKKLKVSGGNFQSGFSQLFNHKKIPIKDFQSLGYDCLYYKDHENSMALVVSGETTPVCFRKYLVNPETRTKDLFQPIQWLNQYKPRYLGLKKKCTLVVGNHRSGTSVLTGCLHSCGLDLGKGRINHTDQFNPYGYFENKLILEFNRKVLKSVTSSWKDPEPISDETKEKFLNFTSELESLIKSNYHAAHLLIKDPRIIFLGNLYLKALSNLEYDVQIIYIDREMDQVVKSLARAQRLTQERAEKLYHKYKTMGEEMLSQIDQTLMITYDQVLSQTDETFQRIAEFLNINIYLNQIKQLINPNFRHYK